MRMKVYDVLFTETAQDAPVFQAGEEWAFLIWGRGRVVPRAIASKFEEVIEYDLNSWR